MEFHEQITDEGQYCRYNLSDLILTLPCEHEVEDKVHLFLWFNSSSLVLNSMEETIIEAIDVQTLCCLFPDL